MTASALMIEIADQQQLKVDTKPLVDIASAILHDHGFSQGELSIALVDDPTIRNLNQQYLNHDWETDVISFVLDEGDGWLAGQLIVSTDTAVRVAKEVSSSVEAELSLYVAHGTLHLVGFDDLEKSAAIEMRTAERKYLDQFSIPCMDREA